MTQVTVNFALIDRLRKTEGWLELVKYFENVYFQAISKALAEDSDDKILASVRSAKQVAPLLNFLRQKPTEVK